jgi:putative FmdB family regulatory protein
MPRYRYECAACKNVQIIFHRITETPGECTGCGIKNQLKKLLTTPTIVAKEEEMVDGEVGELTREYIEANREVLKQLKEKTKKDTYEPS